MTRFLISSSSSEGNRGSNGAGAGLVGGDADGAELSPKSAGQSAGLSDSSPSQGFGRARLVDVADFGRVLVSKRLRVSAEFDRLGGEVVSGLELNTGAFLAGEGGGARAWRR